MRSFLVVLALAFGLSMHAEAQSCTGLCLQQVSCPAGGTTSISGTVYAPNGTDPLPNVIVYIPNAPVDAFTPGVACPIVGTPPSGSPLVGTTTAVDGTFKLTNVPVGANIPLVIQTGRWRRQLVVSTTTACTDTAFSAHMPKNQSEGDIPLIAVATGSADQVECVLRKVGISDSEFTNPGGTGRINLFAASFSPGATIDANTPSEDLLMANSTTLNNYDVLMLPCEGGSYTRATGQLANLISFANAGGRVYSSHYAFAWMYQNGPFAGVANWKVNQSSLADGTATVDTSFSEGQTLSKWLQLVGATTTPGQMPISTLRHDLNGVIAPTQSWLTLNNASAGNPVMQFVFDTPISSPNQCGRVLFNEYHVENPTTSPYKQIFPAECPTTTALTPQEKLLEFSLFELTSDGNAATLTPTSADFGTEAVNFSTTPQTFTWTNNSSFTSSVTLVNTVGDFYITSNNCSSVKSGASCQIGVAFKPTAVGPRTGTLSVGSGATTLTADLTGTGIPDLTLNATSLTYGNVDVGLPVTQTITVTNNASGSVPVPALVTTGDYAASSNCGSSLGAGATCVINVTFTPATTGPRNGTLAFQSNSAAYPAAPVTMTGNGVDFTVSVAPGSGTLVAGLGTTVTLTTTPLAGFASPLTLKCLVTASGSTCTPASTAFTPSATVTTAVAIETTARYNVVGYGGFGSGALWLLAAGSTWMLWRGRRRASVMMRSGVMPAVLAAIGLVAGLGLSGCSGKQPTTNAVYTSPGTYSYTLTVTDGFLVHSATYTLTVTAK